MTTFETLATDQRQFGGLPAYTYLLDDHQVTIADGIVVTSSDGNGVFSLKSGSKLINNGNIHSGAGNGIAFSGAGSSILNNAGHSIVGSAGVFFTQSGHTLTNHGRIIGFDNVGVGCDSQADGVVVNNDGEIYGRDAGIANTSAAGSLDVTNSGLVWSDRNGIDVARGISLENSAGGIIKGASAAIISDLDGGRLSLDNHGTLDGMIDLNAPGQNDVVKNAGVISGEVHLGPGNDSFDGAGGTSGQVLGEAGDDSLTGGKGDDSLDGGDGSDRLAGGKGSDTLRGGDDPDTFVFDVKLKARSSGKGGAGIDSVLDFAPGQDRIELHHTAFKKLDLGELAKKDFAVGVKSAGKDKHAVYYEKDTGKLSYDVNGHHKGGDVVFAVLDKNLDLSAADLVVV